MEYSESEPSRKKLLAIPIIALAFVLAGFFIYTHVIPSKMTFNVDHVFVKTVIKEGEVSNAVFRITNLNSFSNFSIDISGLSGLISVSDKSFTLDTNEVKEINIFFNDTKMLPGVYVGSLIIKSYADEKKVPVILEIQTENPVFGINLDVNPAYKEVQVGGETFSQVNFFNLNDKNLHFSDVEYDIINLDGSVVDSEIQNIVIGSESSVAKSKTLSEDLQPGQYVFAVTLKSNESVSTASYLFSVVPKKFGLPFNVDITSFFSTVVVVFLFLILVLMIYIVYERNKLFGELKDQQSSQLRSSSDFIDQQRNQSIQNAPDSADKEKMLRDFNEAKDKILGEIKNIQEHHREEFEKLDKKKDKKVLEEKLKEWKRRDVYSSALKKAKIGRKLKTKLGVLRRAYEHGYISKESYSKGKSRIKTAHEKIKKGK